MNNEELRELKSLRNRIKSLNLSETGLGAADVVSWGCWLVPLIDLLQLAQLAVLPGDAEPTTGGVTYGEWTELRHLLRGTLFEDMNGERGIVYERESLGIKVALGAGNAIAGTGLFRFDAKVRQIHLPPPAPVAPPQEPEPPLDERAWRFIEKMRDYDGWQEAEDLLAERAAIQGTAGG